MLEERDAVEDDYPLADVPRQPEPFSNIDFNRKESPLADRAVFGDKSATNGSLLR